eukprot:Nk52_evm30s229 gene=Nk52_evmTU30s229
MDEIKKEPEKEGLTEQSQSIENKPIASADSEGNFGLIDKDSEVQEQEIELNKELTNDQLPDETTNDSAADELVLVNTKTPTSLPESLVENETSNDDQAKEEGQDGAIPLKNMAVISDFYSEIAVDSKEEEIQDSFERYAIPEIEDDKSSTHTLNNDDENFKEIKKPETPKPLNKKDKLLISTHVSLVNEHLKGSDSALYDHWKMEALKEANETQFNKTFSFSDGNLQDAKDVKSDKPKVNVKDRFRRAVKTVITENALKDMVDESNIKRIEKDTDNLKAIQSQVTQSRVPRFELNKFKRDFHNVGQSISHNVRAILMKEPFLRTKKERRALYIVLDEISNFAKYSSQVRHELCRVVYYEKLGKDRVVVRQGDVGDAFYFILSGSVYVQMKKSFGDKTIQNVNELEAGDNFGELALLKKNSKRMATIVTKEDCEFLKVSGSDFQSILQNSYEEERKAKLKFIEEVFTYSEIEDDVLAQIADMLVSTQVYPANTVIMKENTFPDHMYFIKRGQCKVVKKIDFSNKTAPKEANANAFRGKRRESVIRRLIQDSSRVRRPSYVKPDDNFKYIHIRTLDPGSYFGELAFIGKNVNTRSATIISVGPVECYILPQSSFMQCFNIGSKALKYLKKNAESYPTLDEILKSFNEIKAWTEYKFKETERVVVDRRIMAFRKHGRTYRTPEDMSKLARRKKAWELQKQCGKALPPIQGKRKKERHPSIIEEMDSKGPVLARRKRSATCGSSANLLSSYSSKLSSAGVNELREQLKRQLSLPEKISSHERANTNTSVGDDCRPILNNKIGSIIKEDDVEAAQEWPENNAFTTQSAS